MSNITPEILAATRSDDELIALLGSELQRHFPSPMRVTEDLARLRRMPPGLRAMAATDNLDVSRILNCLGWHFGAHPKAAPRKTVEARERLLAPLGFDANRRRPFETQTSPYEELSYS